VDGDASAMGGSMSEEFHYVADVGEDQLSICSSCGKGYNNEAVKEDKKCSKIGNCDFLNKNGIEVEYIFSRCGVYVYIKAIFSRLGTALFLEQDIRSP